MIDDPEPSLFQHVLQMAAFEKMRGPKYGLSLTSPLTRTRECEMGNMLMSTGPSEGASGKAWRALIGQDGSRAMTSEAERLSHSRLSKVASQLLLRLRHLVLVKFSDKLSKYLRFV